MRAGDAAALSPDHLARLTLLTLPSMTPARMSWLLGSRAAPSVVEVLARGRLPHDLGPAPTGVTTAMLDSWHRTARRPDLDRILAVHRELEVVTLSPLDRAWPLTDEPDPPALLFTIGDLDLFTAPGRVAIVGTRRCTSLGRTVAYRLGAGIAEAGGTVVSGLALGIDGAAHRGALDRAPSAIGVVGTGLDVIYPRANQPLWLEVADRGLLISEYPAGTRGERWRFPARNRLIAALSEAVVVVESHERGGALSTADEAATRGRPVMAVPGSVLSSASLGTNALLADGAIPVRDWVDVLGYLGYPTEPAGREPSPPPEADPPRAAADPPAVHDAGPADPDPIGSGSQPGQAGSEGGEKTAPSEGWIRARILAEVATGPVHVDQLALAVEIEVPRVIAIVQRLRAAGLVEVDGSTVCSPDVPR